jgi:hypothetical protein
MAQSTAALDHADFYALACSLVDVVRVVDALAGVLAQQVGRYGVGRRVYDDEGHDPAERLAGAVAQLRAARNALGSADTALNEFWSSIGHIGVEVEP